MSILKKIIDALSGIAGSLTALIVSITALIAAWHSMQGSTEAVRKAEQAQQVANTTAVNVEPSAPHSATPLPPGASYILQLATYQRTNCANADEEIRSYGSAFGEQRPNLFTDQTGSYVIVGVKTSSLADAKSAQQKARTLSQSPSQAGNDLGNALIRTNPSWKALERCPNG